MDAPEFSDLGESALLLRWNQAPDVGRSRRIRLLGERLASASLPGVIEWIPGLASLAVYYDPLRLARGTLVETLKSLCDGRVPADPRASAPLEVPVRYGGSVGPDLVEVARLAGLDPEEVVRLHTAVTFDVVLIGFAPGFPYLAGVPQTLRVPRRATPRIEVEAGSVALAGELCGIYPRTGPGGWSVIGYTDWVWFDPHAHPPCRLALGDRIRFRAVDP